MESPFDNLEENPSSALESTIELPILQSAAKHSVDVYLPQPLDDWQGPALQEHIPYIDREHFEEHVPLQGMLRAVDTSFNAQKENEQTASSGHLISSYARQSAKRGRLYTLLFIAFVLSAAAWSYLNFDSLLQTVFKNFQ